MKHCPVCRIDFADTFDRCFRCSADLADGAVEAPVEDADAEQRAELRARLMLERAKMASIVMVVVLGMVLVAAVVLDPSLEIGEQWNLVHEEGAGKVAVTNGGALRDAREVAALDESTGLALPAPREGEMVVYFPVTYRTVAPEHLPVFTEVRRTGDGVVATLGRSAQAPSAALRLLSAVGEEMHRGLTQRRPTVQLVAVARVARVEGTVVFRVPPGLGDEQTQGLHSATRAFAEDLTLGWFRSFAVYVVAGILAVGAFMVLLLKVA